MTKYIVDSSALIDAKETYPIDNFPTFWKHVHELNIKGDLIIPKMVKEELSRGSEKDYLTKKFFNGKIITDDEMPEIVREFPLMMEELPEGLKSGLLEWKGADPYIIARARYLKKELEDDVVVIHSEKAASGRSIPSLCNKMGINHKGPSYLITDQKLVFKH